MINTTSKIIAQSTNTALQHAGIQLQLWKSVKISVMSTPR